MMLSALSPSLTGMMHFKAVRVKGPERLFLIRANGLQQELSYGKTLGIRLSQAEIIQEGFFAFGASNPVCTGGIFL